MRGSDSKHGDHWWLEFEQFATDNLDYFVKIGGRYTIRTASGEVKVMDLKPGDVIKFTELCDLTEDDL